MREERRIVTALFADIVGSTSIAERLDPEDAREVLGGAVALIIEQVDALGGTVKYIEVKALERYTSWAFDLGFIAAADIEPANGFRLRPRIGASIRNLGKDIESIPSDAVDPPPPKPLIVEQPGEHRYGIGVDVSAPPLDAMTEKLHRGVSAAGVSIDCDIVKGDGSNDSNGWCSSTSRWRSCAKIDRSRGSRPCGQTGSCGAKRNAGALAWSISWFRRTRLTGPLTL